MHLHIRGNLLSHNGIGREEIVDMMVTHLVVDLAKVAQEEADTIYAHARFSFLKKLYKYHMHGP